MSDAEATALLFGSAWFVEGEAGLPYSFASHDGLWDGYAVGSEPFAGFAELGDAARTAVRSALSAWADVVNLGFFEVDETTGQAGILRVGYTYMDESQLGYTYAPSDQPQSGDVWLNTQLADDLFESFPPGSLSAFVLLHELGHAIGLKHPHGESLYNQTVLSPEKDSLFNSAMSYYAWPEVLLTKASIDRLPTTPMALDIDALDLLYGLNPTTRSEDDVYRYDSSGHYLETIYDTGGIDTLLVAGNQPTEIDLQPDAWSKIGRPVQIDGGSIESVQTVRIYRMTMIENAAAGEGNDRLVGNDVGNALSGNGGEDSIEGGGGDDTISGGSGADWLIGGAGADRFVFSGFAVGGHDRVRDFSEDDSLVFDTSIFTALADVDAASFVYGRARDADDCLIYRQGRQALYYDGDGFGSEMRPIKIVALKGQGARTFDFADLGFI